jgi:hypothetical protein
MRIIRNCLLLLLFTGWVVTPAHSSPVAQKVRQFQFGVLQQHAKGSDASLLEEIERANQKNLAFLVINGIKSNDEPCSDSLYLRRKDLLNSAAKEQVVSLAGSDWVDCKNEDGKPLAAERLQRLRELFFDHEPPANAGKLRLVRQSVTPQFRNFPENAYWQRSKIIFATINMPAENNHYLSAAGRNSEFEDRLIANRHWLQRIFSLARLHKMRGIVLFTDGNPLAPPNRPSAGQRDGFLEMRKQLTQLAARFPGRIFLVHGHASSTAKQILWRDNMGSIGAGRTFLEITVNPASYQVFSLMHAGSGRK